MSSYDEPGRALLVRASTGGCRPLEATKPVGQDVRGDARQTLAELPEPARAVEQRLDHEQAPAVADAVEGGFERQGLTFGGGGVPGRGFTHERDGSRSGLAMARTSVVTCNPLVTANSQTYMDSEELG